jgi:hypothetical protein
MRIRNAAELVAILATRPQAGDGRVPPAADVVLLLQRAARAIHRDLERACNGELENCPKCDGNGWHTGKDCPTCAGSGYTTGKRIANLEQRVRDTVAPYGLRVYVQGDPRGWPLYLIPEESGDAREDDSRYNQRGFAVCPH